MQEHALTIGLCRIHNFTSGIGMEGKAGGGVDPVGNSLCQKALIRLDSSTHFPDLGKFWNKQFQSRNRNTEKNDYRMSGTRNSEILPDILYPFF